LVPSDPYLSFIEPFFTNDIIVFLAVYSSGTFKEDKALT
jgi:hypothetical protein